MERSAHMGWANSLAEIKRRLDHDERVSCQVVMFCVMTTSRLLTQGVLFRQPPRYDHGKDTSNMKSIGSQLEGME